MLNNYALEQREILLSNTDLSINAQNFEYHNMQQKNSKKAQRGKFFEVKCQKDLF